MVDFVFLPMTFLTGVYGMNFTYVLSEELANPFGYYWFWIVCTIFAIMYAGISPLLFLFLFSSNLHDSFSPFFLPLEKLLSTAGSSLSSRVSVLLLRSAALSRVAHLFPVLGVSVCAPSATDLRCTSSSSSCRRWCCCCYCYCCLSFLFLPLKVLHCFPSPALDRSELVYRDRERVRQQEEGGLKPTPTHACLVLLPLAHTPE